MNADNILNAISNIDPNYIDEAAYELHAVDNVKKSDDKIVSFQKKQRIRKMIYIALPSVAAILLVFAVAISAILRISKIGSATSSAPAAASEAASEAPAEATSGAASEAPADAAAEAPDAEAEEPSATEAMYEASESIDADSYKREGEQALNADAIIPELSAQYSDGILTVELDKIKIDDISDLRFTISRIDTPAHEGVIAEGPISDLTDQTTITGDELILDLSDISLDPGDHRIDLGLFTATFTVPDK